MCMYLRNGVSCALISTVCVLNATAGGPVAVDSLTPAQMQLVYLECARMSEGQLLPVEVHDFCSVAAEALKQREFAGDFEALIRWWQTARAQHVPTPSANPYVLVYGRQSMRAD